MGLLRGFLDKAAAVYDITTSTSTSSGQPIESLAFNRNIKVSLRMRREFELFLSGQVSSGNSRVISEAEITLGQVLYIDSVYYRILNSNVIQFKNRIFGYIAHLEIYHH